MADILEQEEINSLIEAQNRIALKKEKAETAIEKITEIYEDVTGRFIVLMIDISSIGIAISEINAKIKPSHKYYEDFKRLKESYLKRGHTL